jgi:hypothetical protein
MVRRTAPERYRVMLPYEHTAQQSFACTKHGVGAKAIKWHAVLVGLLNNPVHQPPKPRFGGASFLSHIISPSGALPQSFAWTSRRRSLRAGLAIIGASM